MQCINSPGERIFLSRQFPSGDHSPLCHTDWMGGFWLCISFYDSQIDSKQQIKLFSRIWRLKLSLFFWLMSLKNNWDMRKVFMVEIINTLYVCIWKRSVMKEHFRGSDIYPVFLEDHGGRNSPEADHALDLTLKKKNPWAKWNTSLGALPLQDSSNINCLIFKTESNENKEIKETRAHLKYF